MNQSDALTRETNWQLFKFILIAAGVMLSVISLCYGYCVYTGVV